MSLYEPAKRHALWMLGSLVVAILFVVVVDRYFGHSSIAFAIAIVGLVAANRQMLRFNCPRCDKNVFFRGIFVVLWPNRVCGRCGLDLSQDDEA
ncbi:MAG: hypothetical protein SXU28_07910 [Pseudomonadota bacterium]|nr:hypothetical protein [Pseudomonadota bacterium]